MKKINYLLINCIFIFAFWINSVYGATNTQVYLYSDKNTVKKGEEIDVILNIEDAKTAAFTSYIYFDDVYLEYVSGPKMSNVDKNRIIYVWYDEDGGGNPKKGELSKFTFKAKKNGVSSLNVNGEFFDDDGDLIETNFKDFEIRIGEEQIEDTTEDVDLLNDNVDNSNNTNLENLAVENILLYPPFDTSVTSYDLEVPNDVINLNILAVPENENATAVIQGGKNLREGNNSIKVIVNAENGKAQKVYSLNAYRRNEEEEAAYLKEQEDNKKKLEEIYNTQKTSTELEITDDNKEEVSENIETRENNLVLIIIVFCLVLVVAIVVFKYKKNHK